MLFDLLKYNISFEKNTNNEDTVLIYTDMLHQQKIENCRKDIKLILQNGSFSSAIKAIMKLTVFRVF